MPIQRSEDILQELVLSSCELNSDREAWCQVPLPAGSSRLRHVISFLFSRAKNTCISFVIFSFKKILFENFTDAHNTFAFVTFERKSLISTVKGLKGECNNVSELLYVCVVTYACVCSSACSCMCVCRGACERMQACVHRPEVRL